MNPFMQRQGLTQSIKICCPKARRIVRTYRHTWRSHYLAGCSRCQNHSWSAHGDMGNCENSIKRDQQYLKKRALTTNPSRIGSKRTVLLYSERAALRYGSGLQIPSGSIRGRRGGEMLGAWAINGIDISFDARVRDRHQSGCALPANTQSDKAGRKKLGHHPESGLGRYRGKMAD